MTRDQKLYGDSYLYEAFMTRAFRAGRDPKKGTDNGEFRVLEHIKNGHIRKGDYQKQMIKLKKLIAKVVDKVMKWKLTADEKWTSYGSHLWRSGPTMGMILQQLFEDYWMLRTV